jgi:acyl phosphate:glycerol-3-phosphate acyltransferase
MRQILLSAVIGYLLGSIPFGYLLVRAFHGQDVRTTGSGNIGATNVARTSPLLGFSTLLLDALKGCAAVVAAILLSRSQVMGWAHSNAASYPGYLFPSLSDQAAVAALFAILGHVFPVWLGFRGGKGVATAVGAFSLLIPAAIVAAVALFVLVAFLSRYVSLSSMVAAVLFPALAWFFYRNEFSWHTIVVICVASCVIIVRHHQNIRRLLAGTEPRFQLKSK